MIRSFEPKDLPYVVHIDPEFQFIDVSKFIVKVNLPFGYIVYRYERGCVRIEQLRVKKEFRNQGIGTELLESVYRGNHSKVIIIVYEGNEHLDWLTKREFRAVKVMYNYFPSGDGYLFEKEL